MNINKMAIKRNGISKCQIAYENTMRSKRLQAEISQGRRENKEYVKKVEKAKMLQSIENKRQLKLTKSESDDDQENSFVSNSFHS